MSVQMTKALKSDCDGVYNLVNAAFHMEMGDSGLAYRNCPKFTLKDQARKQLDDMLVLKRNRTVLGCVKVVSHNGVGEISLLAVHPDHQGKGYGRALMKEAESRGRVKKVCLSIPSCRTDLFPFFEKLGYSKTVYKSIPEVRKLFPEELNEKKLTREDLKWLIFIKNIEPEEEEELKACLPYR